MKVVAVLGQPMRATHCRAYLAAVVTAGDEATVIVRSTDDLELPPGSPVEVMSGLDLGAPVVGEIRSRFRARLIRWLRSGSHVGMRAEQALRRLRQRMPYRSTTNTRAAGDGAARDAHSPNLSDILEAVWAEGPIDVIAVFDVFQLPDVLEFAADRRTDVVVR